MRVLSRAMVSTILSKKATGADILERYQKGNGCDTHSQWIRELGRGFQ